MGKPLIGYPNYVDGATLSGGSWSTALPATNVQNSDLGVLARSSDATTASTRIDLDLGAAYGIRLIMVYLPNATLSATVRLYADDASDYSSVNYDPGAESVYPSTYFPASTTFRGADVSSSAMTQELWDEGLRYPYIHVATVAQSFRYWRIDINDTGNGDGYVDVARVLIASTYEPTVLWRQGGNIGYAAPGATVRTQGQRKRGIDLTKWRTARLVLPSVPEDEATIQCLDMLRYLGKTQQFGFVFDQSDVSHLQRRSFLASLGSVDPMTFPASLWMDVPLQIEEEV